VGRVSWWDVVEVSVSLQGVSKMGVQRWMKRAAYAVAALVLLAILGFYVVDRSPQPHEKASATAGVDDPVLPTRVRSKAPLVEGETRASVEVLVRGLAVGEAAPLPAAEVVLVRVQREPTGEPGSEEQEADEREIMTAITDRSGKARFDELRPGPWEVHARARGYLSARAEFEVRAVGGPPHRWDLTLEAHASIDLTVIGPAGGAVEGAVARVVLAAEHPSSRRRLHPDDRGLGDTERWKTDSAGRVKLGVVPVQEPFTLVVDHAEKGRVALRFDPFESGEVRSVRAVLKRHTVLVGTVARAPAPGVRVAVECWHVGESARGLVAEHKTPASSDRRFRLTRLAPGRKRLVYTAVTETGADIGTLDVDAPEGVETDVGEIPVENSSVRVLVLTDEDVQPLGEVKLSAIWIPQDLDAPSMPISVRVRPGREVVLRGFAAGQLLLSAKLMAPGSPMSDPDYAVAKERIEFDGFDARVELVMAHDPRSAYGEIRIRVAPPPGVEPDQVVAKTYLLSAGVLVEQIRLSEAGAQRFTFGHIEPGRYQVLALANGFRAVPLTVEVEPGRVNSVVFERWARAIPFEGRVTRGGKGVAGASVQLVTTVEGPRGPPPAMLEVSTDDSGAFRFKALPQVPGLELRATSGSAAAAAVPIDADGSPQNPVLELEDDR